MACPICGPKCSIYYMIISIWGIVMLGVLGVFFQIHSPALFEDVALEEWKDHNYTQAYAHEKYEQNAINCWIAAGIYVLIFLFSLSQERMNARGSYEMS